MSVISPHLATRHQYSSPTVDESLKDLAESGVDNVGARVSSGDGLDQCFVDVTFPNEFARWHGQTFHDLRCSGAVTKKINTFAAMITKLWVKHCSLASYWQHQVTR